MYSTGERSPRDGEDESAVPGGVQARGGRLVKSSGKPVAQIARELGVSFESLRHWIKQFEIASGQRQGLTTDEREELSRLRRENLTLRQEREILKKAAVFFASETR